MVELVGDEEVGVGGVEALAQVAVCVVDVLPLRQGGRRGEVVGWEAGLADVDDVQLDVAAPLQRFAHSGGDRVGETGAPGAGDDQGDALRGRWAVCLAAGHLTAADLNGRVLGVGGGQLLMAGARLR